MRPLITATVAILTMVVPPVAAATPAATPSWVEPIQWGRFDQGPPTDPASELSRDVLRSATRYTVGTWFPQRFGAQTGRYLDLGGDAEGNIRPPASAVMSMATALATGAYDPAVVGVPAADARAIAVRLLTSIAYRHRANQLGGGWGDHWQSAFWAADTATAGWLLWDSLAPDDRVLVERMITHEADRFLDYRVPYYQRPDGTVVTPGLSGYASA